MEITVGSVSKVPLGSPLEQIRQLNAQGKSLKPGNIPLDAAFIDTAVQGIPENSPYHDLAPKYQDQLARTSVRLIQRLGKITQTNTNGPEQASSLMHDAACDVEPYTTSGCGWGVDVAIRLALRHEPDSIISLVDEYTSQHPLLTRKQYASYVASNATHPRQTLESVVAFLGGARKRGILQLSNWVIISTASIQEIESGNYDAVTAKETEAYHPLSSEPHVALEQLRAYSTKRGPMASHATYKPIAAYVARIIDSDSSLQRTLSRNRLTTDDCQRVCNVLALHADTHDYQAVSDAARVSALVKYYLQEVVQIMQLDIPQPLALKSALLRTATYYQELDTACKTQGVSKGNMRALMRNWSADPLQSLRALYSPEPTV